MHKLAAFILLAFVSLFLTACSGSATHYYASPTPSKWSSHIELELRKGNRRNLTESELFLPISQNENSLLFADIRGMQDNNQNQEGNIGIGYRKITENGFLGKDWVLGSYAFLDIRNTEADNKFVQGTVGLEALSEHLDIRANFYAPQAKEKDVSGTANVTGTVVGTQLRVIGTGNIKERALPGLDFEIGYKLPILENTIDAVKIYGGGYYFDANDYRTVAGPRGRLELQWQDFMGMGDDTRLTLGAEIQHDRVRQTTAFGMARLRIPLYNINKRPPDNTLTAIERRMTERVIRDVDIVNGVQEGTGQIVDEAAGILVNGTTVTDVTLLDATDNVAADITAAGAGSIVILDGSQGQIDLNAGIVMQPNQAIIGGGIPIAGLNSRVTGTIGTRPTVTDAGIAGSTTTIFGNSAGNDFTLQGIDIVSNTLGNSLHFNGAENLTIRDVTTTGGVTGISMGLFAGPVVTNGLLENVTIANTVGFGALQIGGTITMRDVNINNPGTFGELIFTGTTNADNLTIRDPGLAGLFLISMNANLNNVTVLNSGTSSFELNNTIASGKNNISVNPALMHCNNQIGNTGSLRINREQCL